MPFYSFFLFLFLLLTEGLHVISLYIFILLLKLHRLHCASQASQHHSQFSEERKPVLKENPRKCF
jgi:hypothetical protein